VAARVEFLSDRRCCVCQERGHQIHHINGNHSDNRDSTLAFLCFEHHDEATRTGGLSRKLGADAVLLYRAEWHAIVEHRRALMRPPITVAQATRNGSDEIQFALMKHEVRKLKFRIVSLTSKKWPPGLIEALGDLAPYANLQNDDLALDILDALGHIAAYTRAGMPTDVAHRIFSIATSAIPTGSALSPMIQQPTKVELQALELGCALGSNIAYDAARYLRDIVVFDVGVSILWEVLRCAHLNKLPTLLSRVEEAFSTARGGAQRSLEGPFDEALRWSEFMRLDALALENPPDMPRDISAQLHKSERGA
jgi:hypothetical protein